MAAPARHVGAGTRWETAAGGEGGRETEGEEEAEEETEREWEAEEETEGEWEAEGPGALRAVFPRDPALFGDAFPVLQRFRACGRVLRIAQHHGPRLGLAANVWEAALALARFLEQQRFEFRGLSVIELGAGTGILGILAAMLGGDVTITDRPAALDQIRENVRLNFPGTGTRPRVRALEWGRDEGSFPRDFQVVLGSDLVYDPASFPALLRALRHLCGPRSRALLSARTRGGDSGSRCFFHRVLPPFFRVQLLWQEQEQDIEIYGVTCRGGPPHPRPGGRVGMGGTLQWGYPDND